MTLDGSIWASGGSASALSPAASPPARAAADRPKEPGSDRGTSASTSVAVVITESMAKLFGHHYFEDVLKGINSAVEEQSVLLVLLTPKSMREMELVQDYLTTGKVDGAILISVRADNPLPRRLLERHLPVVIQGRPPDGVAVSSVDTDNRLGGALAVNHLIAQGRRRIAAIAGDLEIPSAVERLIGYRDALATAGIAPDPTFEEIGDFQPDRAFLAMERLLLKHRDVDAVFAASDLMAEAAIRVLRRAGKRIPEDVAVIGFDDEPIAWTTQPPLSTIRQPIEAMGCEAARLLIREIAEPAAAPRRVVLGPELVVRESTIGVVGIGETF